MKNYLRRENMIYWYTGIKQYKESYGNLSFGLTHFPLNVQIFLFLHFLQNNLTAYLFYKKNLKKTFQETM